MDNVLRKVGYWLNICDWPGSYSAKRYYDSSSSSDSSSDTSSTTSKSSSSDSSSSCFGWRRARKVTPKQKKILSRLEKRKSRHSKPIKKRSIQKKVASTKSLRSVVKPQLDHSSEKCVPVKRKRSQIKEKEEPVLKKHKPGPVKQAIKKTKRKLKKNKADTVLEETRLRSGFIRIAKPDSLPVIKESEKNKPGSRPEAMVKNSLVVTDSPNGTISGPLLIPAKALSQRHKRENVSTYMLPVPDSEDRPVLRLHGPDNRCWELYHNQFYTLVNPNEGVNEEIINAHMLRLLNQSQNPGSPSLAIMDTSLYSRYLMRNPSWVPKGDQYFRNSNLWNADRVMIPVKLESEWHWVLVVADFRENTLVCYDSLRAGRTEECSIVAGKIRKWLKAAYTKIGCEEKIKAVRKLESRYPNKIVQSNNADCGVFVMWVAEQLVKSGEYDNRPEQGARLTSYRKPLAEALFEHGVMP